MYLKDFLNQFVSSVEKINVCAMWGENIGEFIFDETDVKKNILEKLNNDYRFSFIEVSHVCIHKGLLCIVAKD